MSSTPRAKRQFAGASSDPSQRQITSFFSTSASAPGPSPASAAQTTYAPVLPSSVQSSLINVGMRIRKSVPEGYKTGSPHSAFKLWDEGAGGRDNSNTPAVKTGARRRAAAGAAELVPFCGVHSVGGMAVQPVHYLDEDAGAAEMDVPGLTSSQETIDDDDFENPRKRGHVDDDDDDEEEVGLRFDFWDGKVMATATSGNARAMAHPKGRRKGAARTWGPAKQGRGQENCVDDFEEADFLDEKVFGADFAMTDA
ncbi:uncharacterized protein DNG_02906 [Cephalotrichum gorgonifer]|uniref:Uncharacterized protein n=1 Tax=Cephalotrichum gorgonifer TaxID=2041049 RepID=A0AAE8MT90_9PEZI|nr:uncharacterized protein DNG_02906 [Cephalotrichum gorgonifer]